MARPRHMWWLIVPLVVVVLVGVWRLRAQADHAKELASPARARREHRPIPVRTALASSGQVSTVVGATALTVPSKQVPIRFGTSRRFSEVNPVVRAVHVRDGDRVEAGQVLIELDPAPFERAVAEWGQALQAARTMLAFAQAAVTENEKSRQLELESAAAELEFRVADVDFRKDDHARLQHLHNQKLANLNEFLEAAAAYAEARYALSKARMRNQLAGAAMILGPLRDAGDAERAVQEVQAASVDFALARDDLQRCQAKSPLTGYVDKLSVEVGQSVDTSVVPAEVLRLDPIHLTVDFPQERIDGLAVGQAAEVVFDSFPQETFQGKVVRVPVRVDVRRRVLPVVVEVLNPDHRVKVGVSAYVRIGLDRQAITVPAVGVTRLDTKASVFVVESGRAHVRQVKTGAIVSTGVIEVTDGLETGEQVVVFGQQYLREGDPVDTNWRRWARRD